MAMTPIGPFSVIANPAAKTIILSRIAQNTVAILFSRLIEAGSGFIITFILCRYLRLELYGQFAYINAIILAFQPLINLELNTMLVREIARHPHERSRLLGASLALKGFLLLAFLISMIVFDRTIGFTGIVKIAFYLAVAAEILQQLSWIISPIFIAEERMGFEALTSGLFRFICVGGIAVIGWIDRTNPDPETGFLLVFAVLTIGHLARTAFSFYIIKTSFSIEPLTYSLPLMLKLLKSVWIMGLATFFTALSLRVDVYFLKAFKGLSEVSIFNVPHIFVLQLQMIAFASVTAIFPSLSRLGQQNGSEVEYERLQKLAFRILIFIGFMLANGTALFPGEILRILGGAEFTTGMRSMQLLTICIPTLFLNFLSANLLTAKGKQSKLIIGAFVSLILNIGLDILLIPGMGSAGAAIATSFSYLIQLMILLFLLKGSSEQDLGITSPLLKAIPAFLLAMLIGWNSPQSIQGLWIKALIFFSLSFIGFRMEPIEVREQLPALFRRGRRLPSKS